MAEHEGFDRRVRVELFRVIVETGSVPATDALAERLGCSGDELRASVRRLAEGRILVLHPGGDEILMANPFSAVPTAFPVVSGSRQWFGNCIWDALGIIALLRTDATVEASCGDCGEPVPVTVRNGAVEGQGIVHFAVPARKWWDDIAFT